MSVFVNRTINLKKIKAIGFDMDYTIVRYHDKAFEELTHVKTLEKLIEIRNYPQEITSLSFDYKRSIQGLVIDKSLGNLLQISRYGGVKIAYHGLETVDFKEMQNLYRGRVIDLSESRFQSLDTSFSIANGALFSQLVDLKSKGLKLPNFNQLAEDIREMIDLCHLDGSIKDEVRNNLDKYVIREPHLASLLENYKSQGKKLIIITNSDYHYCQLLMKYTIDPFLEEHEHWQDLFEITITLARKPSFFNTRSPFLKVDPSSGAMTNHRGSISPGVYQGGHAGQLQHDLNLRGDQILYLGDHIYGDVVSLKKTFNWRTALVLDPLYHEIQSIKKSRPIQDKIDELMKDKEIIEKKINLKKSSHEHNYSKLEKINKDISDLIEEYRKHFNPYWGEMMRAGQEESRFADQVEKYACLYMTKISDLLELSPKTYFRPLKRILPHEMENLH